MPKKVKIDPDKCIGCGVCASVAPSIFILNTDEGKSNIVEQYRTENQYVGEIPDEMESEAKTAADSCPTQAITIE